MKSLFARLIPAGLAALLLLAPYPARAQKIVYQSTRGTVVELYTMNGDGSGQTRLTTSAGSDRQPDWSPDGSKIVFYSERDGNNEIYIMDADGSGVLRLTNSPGNDAQPVWSPDGSRIAFTSFRDGNIEVYVMNSDGSEQIRRTNAPSSEQSPVWSPDGSQIAYQSDTTFTTSNIYVMNANGGGGTNLTNQTNQNFHHQWSPDGSQIVFASNRDGNFEIYVMMANGAGATRLTNTPAADYFPYWSPDGSRILFLSERDANSEVYVMNADGAAQFNLSNNPEFDHFARWSSDGSRVLFVSEKGGSGREVMAMNADGSRQINLTNRPGTDDVFDAFGSFSSGLAPTIFPGGIVMASLTPKVSTISALSIISIFGMDFTTETILFPELDGSGRLATSLGGVCVEIGGVRSPLFAVTPTQVNIQVPAEAAPGAVGIVLIRNCDTPQETRSYLVTINVEAATPAFFLFPPLSPNGWIAARFNDTAIAVAPDGTFSDQYGVSRPARPGDIILLYGTGWGETEVALATGELAAGANPVLPSANVVVTFGGVAMSSNDVIYVGSTPGTAGLFQLAIRVPAGAQAGDNEVVLTVYGKSTPTGPVVPVMAP